jgi:hypothetical protein
LYNGSLGLSTGGRNFHIWKNMQISVLPIPLNPIFCPISFSHCLLYLKYLGPATEFFLPDKSFANSAPTDISPPDYSPVNISCHMLQIAWFIPLQVGKQVHLPCLLNHGKVKLHIGSVISHSIQSPPE